MTTFQHCLILTCIMGLSFCSNPAYALAIQPHAGLALAGYNSVAHIPRLNAVFLCVPFGCSPVMARLKGDTFACASILQNLSANPFPPCHPYLAVSGKASIYSVGVSPND